MSYRDQVTNLPRVLKKNIIKNNTNLLNNIYILNRFAKNTVYWKRILMPDLYKWY